MNIPSGSMDGPATITRAIETLGEVALSYDDIAEYAPAEATMLRVTGLTLITQMTTEYGQEWFSEDEINFIGEIYASLSGENLNEQH